MAVNAHFIVAVVQTVFYIPIVPIAFYIVIRCWRSRPRKAWTPLIMFSLFRLVGGILTIVIEKSKPTSALEIATLILLNVGLVSLIVCTVGLIGLILNSSIDQNSKALLFLRHIRFAVVIAIVLLIVGGSLSGVPADITIARDLGKAGYILYGVVIVLCAIELVHLYTQKHRIVPENFVYIRLTLIGIPPLAVRAAYGILYEFTANNIGATWDPLYGNATAFAIMCLLPEYLTLLVVIYLGIYRARHPTSELQRGNVQSASGKA